MESTTEVLMLKHVNFGCAEPMAWWKSYSYSLNTRQGKVYFSCSPSKINKEHDGECSDVEVSISVLEDVSEMARVGGAVGSPRWENSSERMLDAPMYHFDLYWTDGTQTGPGTATGDIMKYLRALGKEHAETALPCETPPEDTCKEIAPPLKEENAQPPAGKKSDEPAQETWICTVCGSVESGKRFCAECGAEKDGTDK